MAIKTSLLQQGEQLRQSIKNNAEQGTAAHPRTNIIKKEDISIRKNSVIPSYNKEIENMSAIERLKYEYGVEKNIVLTKENVQQNRELIENYIQYFSVYPDSE